MNEWSSTRSGSIVRITPRWEVLRVGACLATLFSLTGRAQNGTLPTGQFRPEKVYSVTPVNERPDANKLMEINTRRGQQQKFTAANMERKRQLTDDSTRLLQFAQELSREFEQNGNPGLSPAMMEKAGAIEQLAHAVKEKMKLTVAVQ